MSINERLIAPGSEVGEVDSPVSGQPTGPGDAPNDAPPSRVARQVPWLRIGAWLGVLLPLALLVKGAMFRVPSFDGAMNLQVAQNLSHGLGFTRQYIYGGGGIVNHAAGTTLFPSEIQTSGAYIFLAAGLIKIFGASTFVFELPNLIFLALLLVTTSFALRRWPLARIVGPSIVIFAVPGESTTVMQGYGEYVVAALVIGAFVLLGEAASGARRPVLASCGASALLGIALSVKVVAAMALPVVILGLIAVALARPLINRWKLFASLLVLLVPLALVEIQRLVSLRSWSAYATYWHDLFFKVGSQAGVSGSGVGSTSTDTSHGVQKIADHFHLLSVTTGINAEVLLLAVVMPFVVLIGLFLCRGTSWREWLAKPGAVLSVQLACYAGGYLIWWMALTPTSKAWLRRIIIGLVALVLLYLVLAGMARDRYRARRPAVGRSPSRRTLAFMGAWGIVGVLALVSIIPGLTTLNSEVRKSYSVNATGRDQVIALAAAAKQLHAQGDVLYGGGWWSAPVVALYGDLPLRNQVKLDTRVTPAYCDPAVGIITGKAYLIWDFYARSLADPAHREPYSLYFRYQAIPAGASAFGTLYRISLQPNLSCPVGH